MALNTQISLITGRGTSAVSTLDANIKLLQKIEKKIGPEKTKEMLRRLSQMARMRNADIKETVSKMAELNRLAEATKDSDQFIGIMKEIEASEKNLGTIEKRYDKKARGLVAEYLGRSGDAFVDVGRIVSFPITLGLVFNYAITSPIGIASLAVLGLGPGMIAGGVAAGVKEISNRRKAKRLWTHIKDETEKGGQA